MVSAGDMDANMVRQPQFHPQSNTGRELMEGRVPIVKKLNPAVASPTTQSPISGLNNKAVSDTSINNI